MAWSSTIKISVTNEAGVTVVAHPVRPISEIRRMLHVATIDTELLQTRPQFWSRIAKFPLNRKQFKQLLVVTFRKLGFTTTKLKLLETSFQVSPTHRRH